MNGGTCYTQIVGDQIKNEYCICPADKTGETCAEHKPCDLSCVHGTCQYPFTPAGIVTDDVDREPYCSCDEGFSGILCESAIDECPDGKRTCYNGGKCKEIFHTEPGREGQPFKTPRYRCDCSVIDPKSPFAGLECQHPAENICSIMTVNKSSFCVNGGKCKDIVMTEDVHEGCECKPGFEGGHCEYVEGTDPDKVLASNTKSISSTADDSTKRTSDSSGLNGVGVFLIVLAFGAFFGGALITARKLKKKKAALKEASSAYDDNDLAFDADGNRMTNISISGDDAEREGEII